MCRDHSLCAVELWATGRWVPVFSDAENCTRMSPVSRGRKPKKKKSTASPRHPVLVPVGTPDACDCPACLGEEPISYDTLADALLADAATIEEPDDAFAAELLASTMHMLGESDDEFDKVLLDDIIPSLEAGATVGAQAVLLALGTMTAEGVGPAASTAADRQLAAGVPRPGWVTELGQTPRLDACWQLTAADDMAIVIGKFLRGELSQTFVLINDLVNEGAAEDLALMDSQDVDEGIEKMRAAARADGIDLIVESLDPAEYRRRVETALDIRADQELGYPAFEQISLDDEPEDEPDGPPFEVLETLLRTRISTLPVSERAAVETRGRRSGAEIGVLPSAPDQGPVPGYQLKVTLKGSKPPIWRRLQVPSDLSLAELHHVIQIGFGWDDSHLHAFETRHGRFGQPGFLDGVGDERRVALSQVAAPKGKISYTYDFGDDWEHDVLVEKTTDPVPAAACIGGRRAAPPQDCGGIWGYVFLLDVLADPDHPDHDDQLEWLGLDDPKDLDPDAFDPEGITQRLAELRRPRPAGGRRR